MAAAETAMSLAPILVHRTNSFMVSADCRCRRLAAAEARTQSSARYDGARSCRHLKTIMASLNSIRCRIGSQWRSRNTGVIWSNFLLPVTTCAAEFWTTWRCLSSRCLVPSHNNCVFSAFIHYRLLNIHASTRPIHSVNAGTVVQVDAAAALMYTCITACHQHMSVR